jgi:hypothetical protein
MYRVQVPFVWRGACADADVSAYSSPFLIPAAIASSSRIQTLFLEISLFLAQNDHHFVVSVDLDLTDRELGRVVAPFRGYVVYNDGNARASGVHEGRLLKDLLAHCVPNKKFTFMAVSADGVRQARSTDCRGQTCGDRTVDVLQGNARLADAAVPEEHKFQSLHFPHCVGGALFAVRSEGFMRGKTEADYQPE